MHRCPPAGAVRNQIAGLFLRTNILSHTRQQSSRNCDLQFHNQLRARQHASGCINNPEAKHLETCFTLGTHRACVVVNGRCVADADAASLRSNAHGMRRVHGHSALRRRTSHCALGCTGTQRMMHPLLQTDLINLSVQLRGTKSDAISCWRSCVAHRINGSASRERTGAAP